jgi:cell division protein FtsN
MFLLGVIVGRGTAPVRIDIGKLQKELADIKEAVLKKENLGFSIGASAPKETDLEFYEKLKDSGKDFSTEEKRQTETSKKTEKRPSVKPSTPRPPEKVPSPAGGVNVALQVASLKNPEVADEMVDRLKKKGYSAFKTTAVISGKGTWHRVRISGFQNREQVESTKRRLKKDGFPVITVKQ